MTGMTDSAIWIQTKTGPDRWYYPAKRDCKRFLPEAVDECGHRKHKDRSYLHWQLLDISHWCESCYADKAILCPWKNFDNQYLYQHHTGGKKKQVTWCIHCTNNTSHIARFMGPTWGPPGPCRPQMGPTLAPWALLSGLLNIGMLFHYNCQISLKMETLAHDILWHLFIRCLLNWS